jgi:hypothetical protein
MTRWKKSEVISLLSFICAAFVFGFGIWQYRASENWKRSEFVSNQIKEFNSDSINQRVLRMMDYDEVTIELFPNKAKVEDRYVDVTLDMMVNAINKEDDFSDVEFQIRQDFEHFLKSLSRFHYFLTSGAIQPRELCADFDYPVDLMSGDIKDMKLKNTGIDITPLSQAIGRYLARWEYWDIIQFMQKVHGACRVANR